MRGFSLIEMMMGLTIAAVLMLGLMQYSHHTASQYLTWRRHQEAHTNLLGARQSLTQMTSMDEPEFWDAFPVVRALVHEVDHHHHGKQFTADCPRSPTGGCLIHFDIQPAKTPPITYALEDLEWPVWIHPSPLDDSLPVGPGEEIGPEAVIWLQTATGGFPVLVGEVAGDRVYLVDEPKNPWAIPAFEIQREEIQMVVLGQLVTHHISLTTMAERHHALRLQPWHIENGEWQASRSRTGDTHLVDLAISTCTDTLPDRLILVTQPRQPQGLPHPIRIGSTNYQTEVFHATIPF